MSRGLLLIRLAPRFPLAETFAGKVSIGSEVHVELDALPQYLANA